MDKKGQRRRHDITLPEICTDPIAQTYRIHTKEIFQKTRERERERDVKVGEK